MHGDGSIDRGSTGVPVWGRALTVTLGGVVAVLIAHHSMVMHGFRRIQGYVLDTRLIHYILEYSYRAAGDGRLDIWHPPFFYPQRDVAAYTDLLFSVSPLYWLWRGVGLEMQSALQAWFLTTTVLTFAAFYLLVRRGLRLGWIAATCSAVYFSCGWFRIEHAVHPQMLSPFYVLVSLLALLLLFEAPPAGAPARRAGLRRLGLYLLFLCGAVAQLYASFYQGYFYAMGLGIALLCAVARRSTRRPLWERVRRDWPLALTAAAVAALLLAPLVWHNLTTGREMGLGHAYQAVLRDVPDLSRWVNAGRLDWAALGRQPHGFHLITLLVVAVGLYRVRRSSIRLVVLAAAGLVLLCSQVAGVSPWRLVHEVLPGAEALRMIRRVTSVVGIAAAVGLACFVHSFTRTGRRQPEMLLVVGFVLLAQPLPQAAYDKARARQVTQRIAARVDRSARAFLFVAVDDPRRRRRDRAVDLTYELMHLEGMWAGLVAGVPTINGYSGTRPPGWVDLRKNILRPGKGRPPEGRAAIERSLRRWCRQTGLPPDQVQLLVLPMPFPERTL